jgi:DNA helicase-2/ATP-dependent DNA helicase PcrA
LYLTNARFRVGFGGGSHNPPSRFLNDIPGRLTEQRYAETSRVRRPNAHQAGAGSAWTPHQRVPAVTVPARPASASQAVYEAGEKVRHVKFGEGIVVSAAQSGDDQLITVAFKGGVGVKKLMLSFAGLEKV